jgi:DNA repair exonuclease SbcCD ATPase subunit
MKIKKVQIENILSIDSVELELGQAGLVLIDGWNYDDDSANGAGKTAILNAISFAIYGKMPRKITSTGFLRDGTKKGYAIATIECGDTWVVERGRPMYVKFWKNGIEKTITQEEFESSIKMTYSQFLISMYSSQLQEERFIQLNDSGKKDFILQLLNLNAFSEIKDLVDKDLKALIGKKDSIRLSINATLSKIEAYKDSIPNVDDLVGHNYQLHEAISKSQTEISTLDKITPADLSGLAKIEDGIAKKRSSFAVIRNEISNIDKQIQKKLDEVGCLNHVVDPGLTCPHCSNKVKVLGNRLAKTDDVAAIEQDRLAKLVPLNAEITSLRDSKIPLVASLSEEGQIDQLANKVKEKRREQTVEYSAAASRIVELNRFVDSAKLKIKTNEEKISQKDGILSKIVVLSNKRAEDESNLVALLEEETVLETLSASMSPVGAPAYIVDSVVDMFNGFVSKYVDIIWSNASYKLLSFKENQKGDIKARFSEHLTVAGVEKQLGALSGGEFRCLSLAVDFALLDVLSTYFAIELNPIMLDEPFNGLDGANREKVIDLLQKIATDRQVLVIDHASEAKAMFSDIIRVEKRNGISSIAAHD